MWIPTLITGGKNFSESKTLIVFPGFGDRARRAGPTPGLTIANDLYNVVVMQASLDAAFFALSDPTRRAILARLAQGETTVMQLAAPFEMTQPAISRHLRVLEGAGLITRRTEGATRPCRLQADGIQAMERWLAMLHETLSRNYDRLDQVLVHMQSASRSAKTTTRKTAKKRKGVK